MKLPSPRSIGLMHLLIAVAKGFVDFHRWVALQNVLAVATILSQDNLSPRGSWCNLHRLLSARFIDQSKGITIQKLEPCRPRGSKQLMDAEIFANSAKFFNIQLRHFKACFDGREKTMKKILYFSHIPKAAGTTFSSILRQNYGNSYLYVTHGFHEDFMPVKNLRLQLKNNFYKVIGGHRISFDVPYDSRDYDVRCVAFVRNPAERLYSEYRYVRKLGIEGLATKSKSFAEFLDLIVAAGSHNWYWNGQARYQTLDPLVFNRVLATNRLLLFPVDRFDESLFVLRRLFRELTNISNIAANVNLPAPRNLCVLRGLPEVPAEIIDQDLELYSIANQNLDRLLTSFPPRRSEKILYRLGCNSKKSFNSLSRAFLAIPKRAGLFKS